MVKYSHHALDNAFSALADPTRRAMIARLTRRHLSVTELAKPFPMSLPAVSKHIRVLERAGLVKQSREGQIRRCHLQPEPLKEVNDYIKDYQVFWTNHFKALDRYLQKTNKKNKPAV